MMGSRASRLRLALAGSEFICPSFHQERLGFGVQLLFGSFLARMMSYRVQLGSRQLRAGPSANHS
jgi:hypothetical protein